MKTQKLYAKTSLIFTGLLFAYGVSYAQSGNVGIGTSTPIEKLHVNGNVEVNNASSTYGSYVKVENADAVKMTVQSTRTTTTYGARGIVGTTTAHPLQLIYNASPVVYMDNGSLAPNGTNLTFLGVDANRWNGVYSSGVGFDAKNVSSNNVGLWAESAGGVKSVVVSTGPTSAFGSSTVIGSQTNHPVTFLCNNTSVLKMDGARLYPTGNNTQGLGYTSNAYAQVVAYSFPNPSDIRFKKNIKNLNYGVADIMKIRPVTYDLKDNKNEHLMIGFIAQEMEKIIPEIVSTNKDSVGYKSIDYVKLVPVLTKGMQQQQMVIESQGGELKALRAQIEKQNKQVAELSAKAMNEKIVAELAAQVRELRQLMGMKSVMKGNKVARR